MTMRRLTNAWIVAGLATVVPEGRALAQGCAMCGNSFAPNDPTANAINTSVAFLLLMPYTLVAAVGCWLYLRHRRNGSPRRASVIALPWARAGHASERAPEEE